MQRGYQVTRRISRCVANFARTFNGNFLLDCRADSWQNIHGFNAWLKIQNGVVATSLFENIVTDLSTFDEDNQIQTYRSHVVVSQDKYLFNGLYHAHKIQF